VSKFLIFRSGFEGPHLASLAIVAAASLLTFLYALRAFQAVWWESPSADPGVKPAGDALVAPALLILLCLVFGVWGEPVVSLAQKTARSISEPAAYIGAVLGAGEAQADGPLRGVKP
jgi:multicomponent Na+:H+ antiporter subunit D